MEMREFQDALEAQFLMGHRLPSAHLSMDRKTVVKYSWDVDHVRQALQVPLNDVWSARVLELEAQGLASFTFYSYAGSCADPHWEDQPREEHGTVDIHARGVLKLAILYGRPYVKSDESLAVVKHWQLVQGEAQARASQPHDEEQWRREWPERYARWQMLLKEHEEQWGEDDPA